MTGQACGNHETDMDHFADVDRSHMKCDEEDHHNAGQNCCDLWHMEVDAGGGLLQRESTVETSGNCIRCVGVERTAVAALADNPGEGSCFFRRYLHEESIRRSIAHCNVHHPSEGSRRNRLHSLDLDLYIHRLLSPDDSQHDREVGDRDRPDFHGRHSLSAEDTQAARKTDRLAT